MTPGNAWLLAGDDPGDLPDGGAGPADLFAGACDGRDLSVSYRGVRFIFSTLAERDDNGLLWRITFLLHEAASPNPDESGGDATGEIAPAAGTESATEVSAETTLAPDPAMTGETISERLIVSPVIPAATLDKLGPWEKTAIRQGLRKLQRIAQQAIDVRHAGRGSADTTGV